MPYKDPEKRRTCDRMCKKRRATKHISLGLCTRCDEKAIPGMNFCITHRELDNIYHHISYNAEKDGQRNKKRRERLESEGRCNRCGAPLAMFHDEPQKICVNCLIKNNLVVGLREVRNATIYKAVTGQS